jgi:hypothetical protein
MKNYWQPLIDSWILQEADASTPSTTITPPNASNSHMNMNVFGSDIMSKGVPVKSEEEEEKVDKISQPYKGIKTLYRLKDQIDQILGDIYNLSKSAKENKHHVANENNPYEIIKNMLDNPDLKTMLEIASEEIKKRKVSKPLSFSL